MTKTELSARIESTLKSIGVTGFVIKVPEGGVSISNSLARLSDIIADSLKG